MIILHSHVIEAFVNNPFHHHHLQTLSHMKTQILSSLFSPGSLMPIIVPDTKQVLNKYMSFPLDTERWGGGRKYHNHCINEEAKSAKLTDLSKV